MISVRNLEARLGAFHMKSLSLEVADGELMVLLGPSGAGKTVLLESMLGLKPVESGQVIIGGKDVTSLPPEERRIAYMPQDVALFPHLSVRDNILFGRRVRRAMAGADAALDRLAGLLHIRHLVERKRIHSLSGGERQRVALARALITEPSVLFLDESFSALDAHIRRQLLLQLRELHQELGFTVVYVTHSQGEASVVGDRVAVLMAGQIVQVAAPPELFRRPANLEVARFTQLDNVLPVEHVSGSTCTVLGLEITVARPPALGERSWLGVSAEDVLVLRPGEAAGLGVHSNCFAAEVLGVDERHARPQLRVRLEHSSDVILSCALSPRDRVLSNRALKTGDAVEIHLDPQTVSVFPGEVS